MSTDIIYCIYCNKKIENYPCKYCGFDLGGKRNPINAVKNVRQGVSQKGKKNDK